MAGIWEDSCYQNSDVSKGIDIISPLIQNVYHFYNRSQECDIWSPSQSTKAYGGMEAEWKIIWRTWA